MLRNTIRSFRAQAKFPSEGTVLPSSIQGVSLSAQWSFWQQGYQALMITDTAPFRYPYVEIDLQTIDTWMIGDRMTTMAVSYDRDNFEKFC